MMNVVMSLMGKIAGPRVMLGVLLFSLASLGTMGWLLLDVYEDKGSIEQKAEEYKRTANENADKVSRLAADLIITEQTLSDVKETKQAIKSERDDAIQKAKQAGKQGSEEYKSCRFVPMPKPNFDRLRNATENANSLSLPRQDADG